MKIIDVHHHLLNEDHYAEGLLRTMDACGIERVCLSALGRFGRRLFLKAQWNGKTAGNPEVLAAIRAHPDRFVGFGFVQLGVDGPDLVDRLADQGFAGLKLHFPVVPYDAPVCYEVYEKAAEYGLPLLFHTGVFALPEPMPREPIGAAFCQPVFLDRVARGYPSVPVILAHLGIGWYDVAAAMARLLPNVYVDFSGNENGWRLSHPPAYWRSLFYWENSHRKILFGSDVHSRDVPAAVESQRRLFQEMGYGERELAAIFHDNAAALLRLAPAGGST